MAVALIAAFGLASLVNRGAPVSVSGAAARCPPLGKGAGYCGEDGAPMETPASEARCESFGRGGVICPSLGGAN